MNKEIYVVYDRNVEEIATKVAEGRPMFAITADEEHKTMDTVLDIDRWLMDQGANRDAVVYAVGGGVTTDLAGFAASIYKRGVRYANFPTTLLCQVDAGVGGKTGVNLDGFKNMLGVTKFPTFTKILPEALKTLPERELRSGAAEMLKTFIIEDKGGNYEKAVKVLSDERLDFDELGKLVKAASEVKRKIVEKDPFEESIRRYLNLGHTYAHAIEWYQHTHGGQCNGEAGAMEASGVPGNGGSGAREAEVHGAGTAGSVVEREREGGESWTRVEARAAEARPLSHGEAVAIGIIQAAKLSERLEVCKAGLADKLERDFKACHLPTELPCPKEELIPAMKRDKKAEQGIIHFVLIKKIGKVTIQDLNDLQ